MRDDLGLYLKVLRSAMIELINQDYQDFVSLSAELVDLDQKIETIRKPLVSLREEILTVQGTLTGTMEDITESLKEKQKVLADEKRLLDMEAGQQAVAKVKVELEKKPCLMLLERIALNVVQVQHIIRSYSIEGDLKRESVAIERLLLDALNQKFLASLEDPKSLEKCLKIYAMLDQRGEAEVVFRRQIVVPRMKELITETALQNNPRGVAGIYDQIIEFIHARMNHLLESAKHVPGFKFLYKGFWCEVEQKIEVNMISIFAPGNPDIFHQKFVCTMEFLSQIEALAEPDFRDCVEYKNFIAKWNLPVYFQIRFQEIGSIMEGACSKDFNVGLIASENDLKVLPFPTTLICIDKAWAEGVFLPQLFGKFLKLTLQFLSRLTTWLDHAVEVPLDDPALTKASFLMLLYIDIVSFESKFPSIVSKVMAHCPLANHEEPIRKCFNDAQGALTQRLAGIEAKIALDLVSNSLPYIKQVNDIPRLYRKTNREIPAKNCAYVDHTLAASRDFYQRHVQDIGREKASQFLQRVFDALTEQYFVAVSEVLTSVQKTEESLRRLKNLRGANEGATPRPAQGMSDDDKIRLQLQVDVVHWRKAVEEFGVTSIPRLAELVKLVEDATKIQVEDK